MNRNLLVLAGAVLLLFGAMLPWISVAGTSVSGIDDGDGWIVIVLAVGMIITALVDADRGLIVLLILAGLVEILVLYKLIDLISNGVDPGSIGIGIWVLVVGSTLGFAGAIKARQASAEEAIE